MDDESISQDKASGSLEGPRRSQPSESATTPEAPQPQSDQEELQEVKRELTGYERSTLLWTKVIVGINLLTCLFIGLQFREMKSGGSDTHALAQAANTQAAKMGNMSDAANKIGQAAQNMVAQEQRIADNSKSALDASNTQSRDALDAAIDASHLDQRAWIGVHEIEADFSGSEVSTKMSFINSGKTPAKNVICWGAAEALHSEKEITIPQSPPFTYPTVIEPGLEQDINGTVHIVAKDQAAKLLFLSVTHETVYMYGAMIYWDIFKRQHWVKFCFFMEPNGKDWVPCEEHKNDTGDGPLPPN